MATDDAAKSAERLSSLMDGELDAAAARSLCDAWRHDEEARRCWHAWHVIGDVLRSDDLASGHDEAAFLTGLRARLAVEPIVFAPATAIAPETALARRSTAAWAVPSAMAAGFLLVVGAFTVLRPAAAPDAAPPVAVARLDAPAATGATPPARNGAAAPEAVQVADLRVVRDPRLQRYLEAHKTFAGTSAFGVPSAFLRSATVDSTGR